MAEDSAFREALEHGDLLPVYYLHGDDEFLKEQALQLLISRAVDPATRDFNLDIRAAADMEGEALASLLATPPMMAERRLVVLRDPAALRKDAREALLRYASRPAIDLILVLIAPATERTKAADKAWTALPGSVEFKGLAPDRIPPWILGHAERELGVRITKEAAVMLQQTAGNDLGALAAELEKLASFTNGAEITADAVGAVVGVYQGATAADLLDHIAARNAASALNILPQVLSQPKTTGVSLVMQIATQTLAIGWGVATGMRSADYYALLKSAPKAPTGRPWGEAAAAWRRYAGEWDTASIDRALDALLAADVALKETRVSSEEQVLATLILALCTPEVSTARAG